MIVIVLGLILIGTVLVMYMIRRATYSPLDWWNK
jgi:Tfp pilus assembly protein PilW